MDLEVKIKAILEDHGIRATADQLQRIKERTQEVAAATNKNADANSNVTDAMRQQAQEAVRQIEATERQSQATQKLGKDFHALGGAVSGAVGVMRGAISGNVTVMIEGAQKISRAWEAAGTSMRGLFTQLARGAAAAAAPAAVILTAIGAMRMAAKDAEAAMTRWWDEARKRSEAYKEKSAEVKAAAEKDLAEMTAAVRRLADECSNLLASMDAADKRSKALSAARKELELAGAKTPEERAAIESKYAKMDNDNTVLNANLRERNAQEMQGKARAELDGAEQAVRDARSNFDRNPSRANQEAIAAAEANLQSIRQSTGEVFKSTQSQIDDARLTREVAGIRKKTLNIQGVAVPDKPDLSGMAELRSRAEAAQASGNFSDQAVAASEYAKLAKAAKIWEKAQKEHAAAVTSALEGTAKDLDKQKARTKATAESRAGS